MSLSDEIIKVLDALAEKFGLVIDCTSQNVIPYLEQLCGKYVNYEIAISVVWFILSIILLFIGKWLIEKAKYFWCNHCAEPKEDWDYLAVLVGIVAGIIIIIGVWVCIQQVFDIVTCLTFPEKIILEELKLLYTNMKQ